MENLNKLFNFEVHNKLFDIVDQYGFRPWEVVRYEVFMSILYKPNLRLSESKESSVGFIKIFKVVFTIIRFLFYVYSHRHSDTMFILCSRDKKQGLAYDKISDSLYTLADRTNCFTLETFGIYPPKSYKYGDGVLLDMSHYLAKFSDFKYNFMDIFELVKKEFPNTSITINIMNKCYCDFISEYKFYRFIFKYCHIKRVFLVQYGIRKGLFAAANEMGVKMIEFQHGQISFNHPAYSYPNSPSVSRSKIYHPDYLLTFGPYWSKNRYYPGVEDIVIGNESYAEDIGKTNTNGNKKLLVISNIDEGNLLAKRVEEVLIRDSSFFFFFKLHPNQYKEYDYYKERFYSNDRVEVVSSQQSINQLLSQCEGLLLNDSTVELEALRVGKKVFVLTEQNFECMDFVLGEEGVYACKDINEFFEKYEQSQNLTLKPREDFFCKFDENVAKKILKI